MDGNELRIRADALEGKNGLHGTGLDIGEYGFFAAAGESRYGAMKESAEARFSELRELPFTGAVSAEDAKVSGTELLQTIGIFERAPEYTRGLYDEAYGESAGAWWPAVVTCAACVAAFCLARFGRKRCI